MLVESLKGEFCQSSVALCSSGERKYTLPILGLKDLSRFIS